MTDADRNGCQHLLQTSHPAWEKSLTQFGGLAATPSPQRELLRGANVLTSEVDPGRAMEAESDE
jgi:hypothetical protein